MSETVQDLETKIAEMLAQWNDAHPDKVQIDSGTIEYERGEWTVDLHTTPVRAK